MKTLIFGTLLILSSLCNAEIDIYKNTDNTGINKLERIGVIESYLATLSGTLKTMEAKLDATDLKLTALEKIVSVIKDTDLKKIEAQLGEKKPTTLVDGAELDKLKADFTAIKNDDIEKMKLQILGLSRSIDVLKNQNH